VGRLAVGLGVLAILSGIGGCGGAAQSPSVTVKIGPAFFFQGGAVGGRRAMDQGREVRVFTLTPAGHPSGKIALKSVRDGRVKTLGVLPFHDLAGVASVAVDVDRNGIDTAWNLPGLSSWLPDGRVPFPPHSIAGARAWMSDSTIGAGKLTGEQDFWIQGFYVSAQPASDGESVGDFASVVAASTRNPNKISYCLTLEVDGQ
jgi:hypothetical protein